jgi:hypothetical protein
MDERERLKAKYLLEIKKEKDLQETSKRRVEGLIDSLRKLAPIEIGDKIEREGKVGYLCRFDINVLDGSQTNLYIHPEKKDGSPSAREQYLDYSTKEVVILKKWFEK